MKNYFLNAIAQSPTHRHLLTDSAFVCERKEENLYYLLFQKGGTYTEVIIGAFDSCIIAVNAFKGTNGLDPYLAGMSLAAFFHNK